MVLEKNPTTRRIVKQLLTLEDRIAGVPFPKLTRIKQIDVYSCGPAVLTSLFSFVGVKTSQRGIIASLRAKNKIKKLGLNTHELGRASKIVGKNAFTFWKKANAKVSDLDTAINKHLWPVAVEWQGVFYEFTDEDNGHYAIITKIDKKAGTMRIADSFHAFAGVDRKFKIKDFEKRWWDINQVKVEGTTKLRTITDKRMVFVITPKGTSWPKKLGMVRG